MKRKASEGHTNSDKKKHGDSLYQAAKRGDLQGVLDFIAQEKEDINVLDDWTQNTPLHAAASQGHIKVVNTLLAHGAEVNLTNVYREMPLYLAAQGGHVRVVKALLANNAKLNDRDAGIAENLLKERGLSPSPLHISSSNGHIEVVRLLLENHADVNEKGDSGRTALHMAAIGGHTEIMKLLLANQADINAQDAADSTPLHMAICNGHSNAVQLLLANNANIFKWDQDEMSPLKHAISRYIYGYALTVISMEKLPILKLLNVYRENIPLLIKDANHTIWIYGLTPEKKISLTQLSNDMNGYQDIVFNPHPTLLDTEEMHPSIYLEIASKGGHSDTCALAILKLFMAHISKLESQGNTPDINLLSVFFKEAKSSVPLIAEYYSQRHFLRNHYTMSQTHTLFQPSVDKDKQKNFYKARYPEDIEFIFKPS